MDTIDFAVYTHETHTEVIILINGRSLLDYVREVELPFAVLMGAPELAGSYGGVPPDLIFPPSQHLLGDPTWDDASVVLRCPCLECPPETATWLRVRITITESVVIWHTFEAPVSHRMQPRPWTYERLGPFTFDLAQYREALQRHGRAIHPGETIHGSLFLDPLYGWALRILWEPAYLPLSPVPVTLLLDEDQAAGHVYNLRRCEWDLIPLTRPDGWWLIRYGRPQSWRVLLPNDSAAIASWLAPWIDVTALEKAWLRSPLWERIVNPHLEGDAVCFQLGLRVMIEVIVPGRVYRLQPDLAFYEHKNQSLLRLQAYLDRH